ncbi:DUF3120 domain-containing protein [Limnothrix redekei]|uniref:DUF3120 domain-containing protein n=1 Tax=Limnothrix redekei LRLZ20PSL1 TaxID=3112953 RepID=A0ABW7CE51_9CYAN
MVAYPSSASAITPFRRSAGPGRLMSANLAADALASDCPDETTLSPPAPPTESQSPVALGWMFVAGLFLVSGPVFVEAPLVRSFPILSTALTLVWSLLGARWLESPKWRVWGDLLVGFSWSWLAGSLYWGWLRWEPTVHLPMEAIALPLALISVRSSWGRIGSLFYLGSLLGTAITDSYFYCVDLMPAWREAIAAESADLHTVAPILHGALAKMHTPFGLGWAVLLAGTLLFAGLGAGWWAKRSQDAGWMVFSAALLGTLFVDGLFWLSALFA